MDNIEQVLEENRRLHGELERLKTQNQNYAREAFLSDLMGSHQISDSEYQQMTKTCGLNFLSDAFAVVRI